MPIAPVAPPGLAAPAAPAPSAAPAASLGPSFASALARRQPVAASASPAAAPPSRALAALEGIERAQRRLDAVLAAARVGRTFTAQELIALQAEAYRAAQTVDLAAKLVEQGAQAVKSAVNAQV